MSERTSGLQQSGRLEHKFYELLEEFNACGLQAQTLLQRTRLPGWCRRSLFYFLGYVAKADGRVTETDIRFAESLMKALLLSERHRKEAIAHFHKGKLADPLANQRGLRLRLTLGLWPAPAIQILFCLSHAAQLHGQPSKARRHRCEDAIDRLGLPVEALDIVMEHYARKLWIRRPELQPAPTSFESACKLLGVSRQASLQEMKRAYRRRVSECHPDKLGQGLSDKEYALAKERLHRYQLAWDLIKRREKFRGH
ncbi:MULTISPECIES: DnaJ domain-containing protein [Marinobacter]|uniref:DnaJ domain-containing protein n=1 Tax=Marinobacter TaxID=2742 RepID=UPI000DABABCE|nr:MULTISPECIES: DnaJ domain-containing protein [Marinobacter]